MNNEYVYCAETLINGTVVDIYRKNDTTCEKYSIEKDNWHECPEAIKAFEGGFFNIKLRLEEVKEMINTWRGGLANALAAGNMQE